MNNIKSSFSRLFNRFSFSGFFESTVQEACCPSEKSHVVRGCFDRLEKMIADNSALRSQNLADPSKDFKFSAITFSKVYQSPLQDIKNHVSLLKKETKNSLSTIDSAFRTLEKEVQVTSLLINIQWLFSYFLGNWDFSARIDKIENALKVLGDQIKAESSQLSKFLL